MAVTGASGLAARVTALVVASFVAACNSPPAMTPPADAAALHTLASFDGATELRPLAVTDASLSNQYWRIDRLRATRLAPHPEAPGDMFVILRGVEGGYVANAGCGRFSGAYRVEGTGIAFELPASPPACSAALSGRQQQLLDTLAAALRWAIQGQVLELFDAADGSLAAAEAIYFH